MIIVKVPAINGLGKTDGCILAPANVLSQLNDIYSNEQGKKVSVEKQQAPIDKSDLEITHKNIASMAKQLFATQKSPFFFIGGDHSITYSLFKAFSSSFKDAGLLIFDAHADCMNGFKPPTHEDWLRLLIEEGTETKRIMLVGARNLTTSEFKYLSKRKINYFSMKELSINLQEACDSIMEIARQFSSLYLSIDIDVVDPVYAPATGYLEPAGLTSRELVYMVQRIKLLRNLKAVDLVEINPDKDIACITSKLGAKILAEFA